MRRLVSRVLEVCPAGMYSDLRRRPPHLVVQPVRPEREGAVVVARSIGPVDGGGRAKQLRGHVFVFTRGGVHELVRELPEEDAVERILQHARRIRCWFRELVLLLLLLIRCFLVLRAPCFFHTLFTTRIAPSADTLIKSPPACIPFTARRDPPHDPPHAQHHFHAIPALKKWMTKTMGA